MRKYNLFLVILILILMLPLAMSVALAEEKQVTIIAGSLNLVPPDLGDIPEIILNGLTQLVSIGVYGGTITDSTGSGNGWTFKISASPLSNGIHTISREAFKLTTVPSLTATDPAASVVSNIYVGAPNQYIDQIIPLTVFSVGANEGMGAYDIGDMEITLTIIPKEFFSGSYTSTLTYTLQANI